ncbi:MAG TPA: pyruvate dehydrogenase complex dihydrolipoamide acetyltransferase [Stellaceae bacterium]|jgi:pyruvate dehydrogenase E2 component (dihydrolipoamide acetyltransferase)|nr:pyruvate dehydrogenase complex dihydrolipoamide acetyltransferase [Stellaceae bacterium]
MPTQILMPALSPTMTEGSLAKWHKKEGDTVKAGDVLAEIETDKATMEFEAVDEGTLGRILVPEGTQHVQVNQPIAVILGEGESAADIKAAPAAKPAAAPAPKAEAKPAAPPPAAPAPAPKVAAVPAPRPAAPPRADGARIFASPLARRLARNAKLDLANLRGTGPRGRIVRADVEAAMAGGGAAPGLRAPSYSKERIVAEIGNLTYTEIPLTPIRRVIATRMAESAAQTPHFYLTIDCEIDALLRARQDLNDAAGLKVSVNDFVIRAAALTLRQVPLANASYTDDAILRWNEVDVAVAVALDGGLITPIVKNADQKRVPQIAAEMRDLGVRARQGKLKLAEFQGGSFSISNLGMYGVREFTAVINPPQACILAVGVGEERPVVRNGGLAVAHVMTCTLGCDHRVLNGAEGAQWLQAFKKLIEAPAALLV